MSQSRRTDSQRGTNLPPPPPYTPVAQQQRPTYAPPPFPPPGQGQQPPSASSGLPPLNVMNANPQSYVRPGQNGNATVQSPTAYGGTSSSATSTNPFHSPPPLNNVAAHARRMSEENAAPAHRAGGPGIAPQRQPSIKENQLELLRAYDTIFIVDDSSSMNVNERKDGSMGQSRWEEARDALAGMVELAAKYDDDGVEVHFLNNENALFECREPERVRRLFDSITPEGVTPTGTKLEMLLLQYMDDIEQYKQTRAGKEPKKRNYVIITDGAPTDDPESVIVATAMRLDRGNFPLTQIGIQFVQVGDDEEAKEALAELDDALQSQHACRDIVDTVPYSGMALDPNMLVKALLGGINRRLDRRKP